MGKDEHPFQIKVLLSADDHRAVRIAAAANSIAMTEFARRAVRKAVGETMHGAELAGLVGTRGKRPGKQSISGGR